MSSIELPCAYGGAAGSGILKQIPDDFTVEEVLGFTPSGEGEHTFLRIEKTGANTDAIAARIAEFAGVPRMAVSYAGLKDRHARTIQWFSAHLPGKQDPDWQLLDNAELRILQACRHNRKLKTGTLKGNRFHLRIRQLAADQTLLEQRLQQIADNGVPNYFGPQRFGHHGQNIEKAKALFDGSLNTRNRHLRGIYLSAARSLVFNRVLAERVRQQNWDQALEGDAFTFPDSHSYFCDALTPEIVTRVATFQIHPSGPLWGKGELPTQAATRALEEAVARQEPELCSGLERGGVEMARRALRINPGEFSWRLDEHSADGKQLQITFTLPAGAYATTLLREALTFDAAFD
jgi:tRNA pseudouridine13 synthase